MEYSVRRICADDYAGAAAVYNSNRSFLLSHLGVAQVDEEFISQEVEAMDNAGFCSCVIVNQKNQAIQGVLDYRPGKEAYLSLLMLDANIQRKAIGRRVYALFERDVLGPDTDSIRIDVVNDTGKNALSFWKRLGFQECTAITLAWRGKQSRAMVMRKKR